MVDANGNYTADELLAAANAENALGASAKSSAIDVDKLKKALDSAGDSGLTLSEVFEKVSSAGMDMGPVKSVIEGVFSGITSAIDKIAGYSGIISAFGNSVTRDFLSPLKEANVNILENFLPKGSVLSGKVEAINASIKSILDTQNTARVGFTRLGLAIQDADEAATEYPTTLRRMAAAYSMSGEKLDGMMKSLQGVPIVLDQTNQLSANLAETQKDMVSELGKLSQAAKTFGMSEDEAALRAKKGYTDFNQTVTETISSMATMSAASKQTGIDRKIADDQIMAASQSLAIFGQKSDAAAGTWTTFTSALKDTIPIRQVGELVTEVTNKIAGMSVQNRAFIGMMSGVTQGRSAMGGALQLELAMRSPEGMEKNLQALTSSLAQFGGGKVITLEEAANNPQLEIQFQLQREMLGKISGISDTQTQNRVLEVLQKVNQGGMSQVEGGKELSNLMDEGKSIQDKQLTSLERIVGYTKILAAEALGGDKQLSQLNDALVGRTLGTDIGTPTGMNEMSQALIDIPATIRALETPEFRGGVANYASGFGAEGAFEGIKKVDWEGMARALGEAGKEIGLGWDRAKGKGLPEPVKPITPATVHKTGHDIPEKTPSVAPRKTTEAGAYLKASSDTVATSQIQAALVVASGQKFKTDVTAAAKNMAESVKGPEPIVITDIKYSPEVPKQPALVPAPIEPPITTAQQVSPETSIAPVTTEPQEDTIKSIVNPVPSIEANDTKATPLDFFVTPLLEKIKASIKSAQASFDALDIKVPPKQTQAVPTEIKPTTTGAVTEKSVAKIATDPGTFTIKIISDKDSEYMKKIAYDIMVKGLQDYSNVSAGRGSMKA